MGAKIDTDLHWQLLGERQPFWAVLTDQRFRSDAMTDADRDDFYRSGEVDLDCMHAVLKTRFGAPDRFAAGLDFGCGVARLLSAMALRCGHACGVDVAASMRLEAQAQLARLGLENASVHESVRAALDAHGPFDWISSYIVLQHIPPERGYGLIADLAAATKPGGWISLHVTTAREARLDPRHGPPWRGLRGRVRRAMGLYENDELITMFDYDLGQVLRLLESHGFPAFWLTPTDHGGHYGHIISSRRTAA